MNNDEKNDRQNKYEEINETLHNSIDQKHDNCDRRYCRISGCTRVVKSQGLCQRHGAKPKLCNVKGCTKQAQGNHDGMCIAHFKKKNGFRNKASCQNTSSSPNIISVSGSDMARSVSRRGEVKSSAEVAFPQHSDNEANNKTISLQQIPPESLFDRTTSLDWQSGSLNPTLLALHLERGYNNRLPLGWHRNDERIARELNPAYDIRTALEEWESDLAWEEILLLAGMPDSTFMHLAHAWGHRYPEFHQNISLMMRNRHCVNWWHDRNVNDRTVPLSGKEKPQHHSPLPMSIIPTVCLRTTNEGSSSKLFPYTSRASDDESLIDFAATDSIFDSESTSETFTSSLD